MKILHTADWHLGKKLEGYYRLDEQKEVMNEICNIAINEGVDAVLIAGDVYDTYNPPTEAIELFYKTIYRLTNKATIPVIVIAGNHDSPDRLEAPEPLAIQNGIFFVGYPDTNINEVKTESGIEVSIVDEGFAEFILPKNNEKLRIIFSPYANEYRLKKAFKIENPEKEFTELLTEKWKILAEKYCDEKGVNIMMSHLFFTSKNVKSLESTDEEKPIVYVGGTQSIDIESIPSQIQYAALGHLHRFQFIGDPDNNVVYSGSPLSYSFAEADQKKYIVIVDIKNNILKSVEKHVLQSGKSLKRVKFESIEEAVEWLEENQNSLVELTIKTENFISSEERKKLNNAHPGIVYINPEIVKDINVEIEDEDIDPNQDIESLFTDYFIEKKKQKPNERLIDLFREIVDSQN